MGRPTGQATPTGFGWGLTYLLHPQAADAVRARLDWKYLLADTADDSDALRAWLWRRGCQPVIPNTPTRKRKHPCDPVAYRERNVIERTFGRLKDWRRVATRYDKLAQHYRATVILAAILLYWL